MNLSLSFDHRVIDGFDAAQFVAEIKRTLEAPAPLGGRSGLTMARAEVDSTVAARRALRRQVVAAAHPRRHGRARARRDRGLDRRGLPARDRPLRRPGGERRRSTAQRCRRSSRRRCATPTGRCCARGRSTRRRASWCSAGRIGSYAETRGTEAAVVGAVAALSPDDVVAPGRRDAGAALARGYPVAALAAQLFGNAHDLARGRRIPGCPALPRALNILPASSHAATQLPHAAGVAWAAKMQKKPTVALATARRDRGRRRGLPHRGQLRRRLSPAGDLRLHQRRKVGRRC